MADTTAYLTLVTSLEKDLDAVQTEYRRYDDYYSGKHPVLLASEKWRGLFGRLFTRFSDNFCALVVDAVEERLTVQGFRMGAEEDSEADDDAWRIWQTNQLDAWSQVAHTESLVKGCSYMGVSPFRDEWPAEDAPLITVEDAFEVVVRTSTSYRGRRIAALKKWKGDDGEWLATLYLPDEIVKLQQARKNAGERSTWEPRAIPGESWPLVNPLGIVPIIPLVNRPRLRGNGESEIAGVIPVQDAINKLAMDMLVAAEYGAFRQRWATGVEIPMDPETGKPIDTYKTSIDRFISTPVPDARFGEFGQTDLAPYKQAIEMFIQHIASTTRTPPHYLLGQAGSFPSGESLKATETGLVAKAHRKMRHFGEAHEEVIRLAFRAMNDPRGEIIDSEVIWADPESRSEAEHTDAALKKQSLGIPKEQLWEDLGYTPQQIERFKEMQSEEALATAPLPPPPEAPTEMTISKDEMGVTRIARGPSR